MQLPEDEQRKLERKARKLQKQQRRFEKALLRAKNRAVGSSESSMSPELLIAGSKRPPDGDFIKVLKFVYNNGNFDITPSYNISPSLMVFS